jgi:hypothetical protein
MKGATIKITLENLGITASYSRPRVSNNTPFSEALLHTSTHRPNWLAKEFGTKYKAQACVKSFASWYHQEHFHNAVRFVTPNMRHSGQDRDALEQRAVLYANARATKPERWPGKTRNWKPAGPVWLNPERESSALEIRPAASIRRTTSLTNSGVSHPCALRMQFFVLLRLRVCLDHFHELF